MSSHASVHVPISNDPNSVSALWSDTSELPGDLPQADPAQAHGEPLLESKSPELASVLDVVSKAAKSRAPVMILGESGTGKGVLAEWLHRQSARASRPFVAVNCPALSEELLTAELFGYARGAFTGAVRDKPGRVEAAHGGTLFLDEIGDLPLTLQVKLLRFLQDGTFERLGEVKSRYADVRIVAATNRDPQVDLLSGRLRLDLYYRLNVVEVCLPPLRDRLDDVVRLAEHLLREVALQSGRAVPTLSVEAQRVLRCHQWPGNVRELRNELERALAIHAGPVLDAHSFSPRLRAAKRPVPFIGGDFTLAQIEREHIERLLARSTSFEAAAATLGIDDSTLWRKRKRFAADPRA